MFKKVFDIDFSKLAILLLPSCLRGKKMIDWVQSSLAPIAVIYSDFISNRQKNIYKLAHSGQVCYLRKALNDDFDPSFRRINISDGNRFKRIYIYTKPEKHAKYLAKIYLRQRENYADTGIDFRVIIPKGMEQVYKMNALIDFYKLASKRYIIETNE